MKRNFTKIFAVFLLMFLIGCAKNLDEVLIDNGNKLISVNVEIADDNDERARGLMFRENLDQNEGMLFVFDDEDYRSFWMKNTLIPLGMIFIDKNFKIVDIKNAGPCKEDHCTPYKSYKPAQYVLEVNSGFTTENNVQVGDRVILRRK